MALCARNRLSAKVTFLKEPDVVNVVAINIQLETVLIQNWKADL